MNKWFQKKWHGVQALILCCLCALSVQSHADPATIQGNRLVIPRIDFADLGSVELLFAIDTGDGISNSNNGKDHWNVTSMLAMGAGINGNRVVGGTDANVEALPVNTQTLQPDAGGVILTPEHIHVALRDLAGVPADLDSQFGIQAPLLNIFN